MVKSWCLLVCTCSLITTLTPNSLRAASPGRWDFEQTFGGTGYDSGNEIHPTSDAGLIMVGSTSSFGAGGSDVFLVKTDRDGNLLWMKTIGGVAHDSGYSVDETAEGGFVITGTSSSYSDSQDVILIKTNASGETSWIRTFGGPRSDSGYSVRQTVDGCYIITGTTLSRELDYNVLLIKTDSDGTMLWSRTFGESGVSHNESGVCVRQTRDGGFCIAGTRSFGTAGSFVYLVKADQDGNQEWSRSFVVSGVDSSASGRCVEQLSDHGFILCGSGQTYLYGHYAYLIRTDASGEALWEKRLPGYYGNYVQPLTEGGFVLTGQLSTHDVFVHTTDDQGNLLWTASFGGGGIDEGQSLCELNDGSVAVCGSTDSFGAGLTDVYLIRVSTPVVPVLTTTNSILLLTILGMCLCRVRRKTRHCLKLSGA